MNAISQFHSGGMATERMQIVMCCMCTTASRQSQWLLTADCRYAPSCMRLHACIRAPQHAACCPKYCLALSCLLDLIRLELRNAFLPLQVRACMRMGLPAPKHQGNPEEGVSIRADCHTWQEQVQQHCCRVCPSTRVVCLLVKHHILEKAPTHKSQVCVQCVHGKQMRVSTLCSPGLSAAG